MRTTPHASAGRTRRHAGSAIARLVARFAAAVRAAHTGRVPF